MKTLKGYSAERIAYRAIKRNMQVPEYVGNRLGLGAFNILTREENAAFLSLALSTREMFLGLED